MSKSNTTTKPVTVVSQIVAPNWAALIGLLPLFTICDRWDVGGVSIAAHPQTGEATIVIYDGYPGDARTADLGAGTRAGGAPVNHDEAGVRHRFAEFRQQLRNDDDVSVRYGAFEL